MCLSLTLILESCPKMKITEYKPEKRRDLALRIICVKFIVVILLLGLCSYFSGLNINLAISTLKKIRQNVPVGRTLKKECFKILICR